MRKLKIESLQSKKQGWVDRDVIMLHSCFQLLKDCVEKENVDMVCSAITEFNSKQETLSHIHSAILNIEKSN
jgi:hypothetical protein